MVVRTMKPVLSVQIQQTPGIASTTHQTIVDIQNLNVNKPNITYLNVCGISSKLLNPDFETLINNYDILVLVETKN